MVKVATDFNRIIELGRERRRNQTLAESILLSQRRKSTGAPGTGPSLASRVGVRKVTTESSPRNESRARRPATTAVTVPRPDGIRNVKPGSLASRITVPGQPLPPVRATRAVSKRSTRVESALDRSLRTRTRSATVTASKAPMRAKIAHSSPAASASPVPVPPAPVSVPVSAPAEFTIKGLAGPFLVVASNFAQGTTSADIESAMSPIGGHPVSCKIVSRNPIVAEIVFNSKEGADRVVSTFHHQHADGRLISVELKPAGYASQAASTTTISHAPPRAAPIHVVDGSAGFDSPVETIIHNSQPGYYGGGGGLYSDYVVRKGRGFHHY